MNKLFFGLLLVSALGALGSCKDSRKIPAPDVTSVPLILARVSSDVTKSYFDTQRARASATELPTLANPTRPVFEFTFDVPDQRDVQIKAVEVYKSFRRDRIGPRALVGSYSSFPATVSINSQDALTGLQQLSNTTPPALNDLLGTTPGMRNSILSGDLVIFTFEYVLQNGTRVILTPLTEVKTASGTTVKVISGTQINPPYAIQARFFVL